MLPAADWKPIDPALLSATKPKLDPAAAAETIFWDVYVHDDNAGNNYLNHIVENYVRIKLYTAQGVEQYGNIEIPYASAQRMSLIDLAARTITPAGKMIEVPTKAMTDQMVEKTGRSKVNVRSFAMPGLEAGAVIEYRWTEVYSEYVPRYVVLPMQREIPSWEITYHVRPFAGGNFAERMRSYPFNCAPSRWEPVRGDARHLNYVWTRVVDVPAFTPEPYMAAEDDVKAWVLIFYTPTSKEKPESYWPGMGKEMAGKFRSGVKANDEMKKLALSLTANAPTAREKAAAIAAWTQTNLKNVFYPATGITNEDRSEFFKKLKDGHNSTDTFRSKMGTPEHLQAVFYAMAEAAGLNPVYVRAGSANSAMFRPDMMDPYLLDNRLVGIKEGEQYHFFNPGIPFLPPGMLDWDEQGQPAVVADSKNAKLMMLPVSSPEESTRHRRAQLKVSEKGALSGTIEITYTGHYAVNEKRWLQNHLGEAATVEFQKYLEGSMPGAQIQDLKLQGLDQPMAPLKASFTVEMPSYAQRTGKRLLLPASPFHVGATPRFPAATRKYQIYFRNAFRELDEVEMNYPENFELEDGEMPGMLDFGAVASANFSATVAKNMPRLNLKRELIWGRGHQGYFEAGTYPQIKKAWDMIHTQNTHALTLKEK